MTEVWLEFMSSYPLESMVLVVVWVCDGETLLEECARNSQVAFFKTCVLIGLKVLVIG